MAKRRMFSMQIVDSDAFLDMPLTSQLLYFHLAMRADDEGFIGNPKRIIKTIGANEDDFKILIAKRFLLTFESGVVVIKHWLIHNTIRMDRHNETAYLEEKRSLKLNENKGYTEMATKWQPNGNQRLPQVKLSKAKLSKSNLREDQTPSQKNQEFFENIELQEKTAHAIAEKYQSDYQAISQEMHKFVMYWTEPNKSGSKVRWQTQNTFDVSRRLVTWFNNIRQYQSKATSKTINLDNL